MAGPTGIAQPVEIRPGDGIVIHPVRGEYPVPEGRARNHLEVEADYGIGIPQKDGTVHTFPIDETHSMHPSNR